LLNAAAIRRRCLRLGIARVDAGPQAIALTLRPGAAERLDVERAIEETQGEIRWSGERLVKAKSSNSTQERLEIIVDLLERLS
jgi:transcription-repair coupling factor (superfamily II helicase)